MEPIVAIVKYWNHLSIKTVCLLIIPVWLLKVEGSAQSSHQQPATKSQTWQRININEGWRDMRYTSQPDNLTYDERPQVIERNDNVVANTKPTEAVIVDTLKKISKKWKAAQWS